MLADKRMASLALSQNGPTSISLSMYSFSRLAYAPSRRPTKFSLVSTTLSFTT
ncbi:MAG: hypothetical protein BWY72_01643 [Bacteroidetes bacterium ADurb.Bin416]|nr:MAG: hypothetical protein BWY72_01643 [Bacteroidetes bacterium ADurb.Bin416]